MLVGCFNKEGARGFRTPTKPKTDVQMPLEPGRAEPMNHVAKNPNPNGVLLMKSDGSPPVESGRLLARILQKKAISTTAQSNVVKID